MNQAKLEYKYPSRSGWLLIGIVVAGFLLRFYHLGFKCFWQDEGVTWYIGNGILHSDAHPGFYFFLLNKFLWLLGNDEFAGRSLSALAGAFLIWVIYLLVRTVFDRKAALITAFLVAISPYGVAVSQEMRMYPLLGLEIALAFYLFWHIGIETSNQRWGIGGWIGFFIVAVLGLYTHSIFGFLLLFLSILYFIVHAKRSPGRLLHWIGLCLLIGLAYFPQFLETLAIGRRHIWVHPQWNEILRNLLLIVKSLGIFLYGRLYYYYTSQVSVLHHSIPVLVLLAVVIALTTVGLLLRIRRNDFTSRLLRPNLAAMVAFFIFNILLFLVLEVSSEHHMIMLYISFVILLGVLLSHLRFIPQVISLTLICLISIVSLWKYYDLNYPAYEPADWRAAGKFLVQNAKPEDMVFYHGGRNGFYCLNYYSPQLSCKKSYLNTKKWPRDPFQREFKVEYYRQPDVLLRELFRESDRIWAVSLVGGFDPLSKIHPTHPESTRYFGPGLRIILLTNQ